MNYNNGQVQPMSPMNQQMQLMQQMEQMQRMQQMGQEMQMPPQMPQMPQMQPQMPAQMPPQMYQMPQMPQQIPPQVNAYQGGAMPNARPMEPMAQQMAQQGRYGDSMLVHMNPAEVQGIAALSPTGSLTTNPMTGQPEAFLPFLAPLLGSMFGSSLLAGSTLGGLIGGAGLSSAAAGAIGSGLATTLATGDVKKGLLSGITGFGLGKALGAAGDALNPDIANTTAALGDASTAASEAGKNLALTAAETADPIAKAIEMGAAPATNPLTGELVTQGLQSPIPGGITDPLTGAAMNPVLNQSQMALADPMQKLLGAEGVRNAANANVANLSGRIDSLRGAQTAGDRLLAPFKQPGTFGKALMQPANLAAIGIGEGKIAEIDARELAERDNRRFEEEKQAEYDRAIGNMEGAFDQLESDYAYRDYNIPRMSAGGVASINPQNYADNVRGLQQMIGAPVQMYPGGEIPIGGRGGGGNYNFTPTGRAGSGARQAGIRGTEVISAEELQGTRPGFQPEITYFRAPPAAADTGAETDGGSVDQSPEYNVDLSEIDFSNIDLSNLGLGGFNIPDYLSTPEGNATVGTINDVLNVESAPVVGGRKSLGTESAPAIGGRKSLGTYEDIVDQTSRTGPRGASLGRKRMAEGREVELSAMDETLESNGQLLIERTVEAISGQLSEDQASAVVANFIDEFGPEAFQMLREKVLEQIVPGSQKEGEIRGAGGGMDDMIPGMIGNSQPVAVSPGEYIIPADVVSGLGDGSTDAGVGELDQMLDRVRQERTGTLRQPAPMRVGGALPA